MITLYDAARCPFCARARIVLAEKAIEHDTVLIDLDERPSWIVDLNPPDGRVPVIEQPGQPLLPESRVIMRYLDECVEEPQLMPETPEERALVDLAFEQFDWLVSGPYYRLKNGNAGPAELDASLVELDARLGQDDYLVGSTYSLADIAYVPGSSAPRFFWMSPFATTRTSRPGSAGSSSGSHSGRGRTRGRPRRLDQPA